MKWTVRALIGVATLVFFISLPGVRFFATEAISWDYGDLITLGVAAVFVTLMVWLYRTTLNRPEETKPVARRGIVAAVSIVSLLLLGASVFLMWFMIQVSIGMANGDRLPQRPRHNQAQPK